MINSVNKVKRKIMSDSVVYYIKASEVNAFRALLHVCSFTMGALFLKENIILIRGAITKGPLYVNNDIIFGQGLTNAYILESNSAIYPRIIIEPNLLENELNENKEYTNLYYRDFDYWYCVENSYLYSLDKDNEAVIGRLKMLLNKESDNNIRQKYIYLIKRYEEVIDKIKYFKSNFFIIQNNRK